MTVPYENYDCTYIGSQALGGAKTFVCIHVVNIDSGN